MRPYLLASIAALVAGAFAFPAKTGTISSHHERMEAADLSVLARATRLVLVIADDFDSPVAKIELYERSTLGRSWRPAAKPLDAVVGRGGLAWWPSFATFGGDGEPIKSEPDERTPAGIFPLGRSFGFDTVEGRKFDITLAKGEHYCVDDVSSPLYNRIVREEDAGQSVSGERMWQLPDYRRGIVIDYPTDLERHPASCVFVHIWQGAGEGTAGCIGLTMQDVEALQAFSRSGPTAIAIVSKDALQRFGGALPQPSLEPEDLRAQEESPQPIFAGRRGRDLSKDLLKDL